MSTVAIAARLSERYEQVGEYLKAAEAYESAYSYNNAIENYRKAGLLDKVIELVERTGDYYEAAHVALDPLHQMAGRMVLVEGEVEPHQVGEQIGADVGHVEPCLGVEVGVALGEPPAAGRDGADAPPLAVADGVDLVDHRAGGGVARTTSGPSATTAHRRTTTTTKL